MAKQQSTPMKFDPATGEVNPIPASATEWRILHGRMTAWLFNPWTGERRDARDVGMDVHGQLIIPVGEPVYAAPPTGEITTLQRVMRENNAH